jgi:beta-xylosidase
MGRADRHGDLVETPSGESWMVYLCGRPLPGSDRCVLGREAAIQPMHWGEDGWLRTIDHDALPVAAIAMDVAPQCFQQAAGLICYYNSTKFHVLHVTLNDAGGRQLQVLSALPIGEGDTVESVAIPVGNGPIALRVEVDQDPLRIAYRMLDAVHWCPFPGTFDASLLSDEVKLTGVRNFTGAFLGMACQDLAGTGIAAASDHFRNVEHPGDFAGAPCRTSPTDRQTRT